MEKESIAPRQYHEDTGRKVRSDKFLTSEAKKAKARATSAEWRLQNGRIGASGLLDSRQIFITCVRTYIASRVTRRSRSGDGDFDRH